MSDRKRPFRDVVCVKTVYSLHVSSTPAIPQGLRIRNDTIHTSTPYGIQTLETPDGLLLPKDRGLRWVQSDFHNIWSLNQEGRSYYESRHNRVVVVPSICPSPVSMVGSYTSIPLDRSRLKMTLPGSHY